MSLLRSLPSNFHRASVALEPALALAIVVKLVTKLGMCNLNQRLSPLTDGSSMQIGNAVFRDHVVHVGAPSQNTRAIGQPGDDSRYRVALRRRRQRNDRLAIFRARRPADEIKLPAKAAVELRPDRFGAHRSEERRVGKEGRS